ncbi:MAG: ubiquinone/menaquinone biosynthesis methyltransferase [Thermodesulfobacteriota bacterium]|nr:ubiquinone/menaquinone biosynthesis methyltransferase [Thermodesulfobacteriota bacterium]
MSEQKNWRPLQKMFNEVPGRYDLLNRLITLGLDEHWRKCAVRECLFGNPDQILDLCTGTGDLVLRMAKNSTCNTSIHALDYSESMLKVARQKAGKKSFEKIKFIHGDAAEMPFKDDSMDTIGIGFAFRNLTYKNPVRDRLLSEIYRVLKADGKLVIIESSQPSNSIMRSLFRMYLKVFVAGLGGIISGHRGAYRYLAVSARNFFIPEEVRELLLGAGFQTIEHRPLSGGIAGLTIAVK